MQPIIFALLVFVCFCSSLKGQSLGGHVVDPQGAALPNAQVNLYPRESTVRLVTTTDDKGEYRFERLSPGEYILEAEAAGFSRTSPPPIHLERGTAKLLDLTLSLAAIRQEVTVTASGNAQTVDETSKALTVVIRKEIEERDEFAVSEALRNVPGLRLQQLGGPGALTSIKTRGMRTEDTAVLIDGQRLRDVAAPQGDASGLLGDLIVTNIDRLEVLRGSGSSLYGTNAIGGVVNIITDDGGGRTRGSLFSEGGSLGFFRGRAQISGGALNDRVSYSAGIAHLNVTRGVDDDDAARNTSAQGRIRFQVSPSASLSARIYAADAFQQTNSSPIAAGQLATGIIEAVPLSSDELRRYEAGTPLPQLNLGAANFIPAANDPDFRRVARFVSSQVTFAQRPRETFGYKVSYQNLTTNRAFHDGPGGVSFQPFGNTRTDYDGRLNALTAQADARLGRSNFLNAGYELESEQYLNRSFSENPSDNSTVDVTQRSSTFFVQDQVRLLQDRLQLSAAFRTQSFSLRTPQFLPESSAPYQGNRAQAPPNAYTGDGSLAYFFRSSGTKFRAHVGNGYRAPSLYERFGTFYGFFGYSAYGDPRLRPDRSIAFDAGIDQSFFGSGLRISATYFYTRLQEIIVFDFSGAISPATDPFGRFGGYRNSNGGLARGLEFSASTSMMRSLDLSLAYTYTNADQRQPLVPGIIRSYAIPNHQFSVVATRHIGRRLFVSFDLTASSNTLAPLFDLQSFSNHGYQFNGIAKADLGASYRFPIAENRSLRFHVKLENLFNQNYYESGYRTPGATAVAGMQFEF